MILLVPEVNIFNCVLCMLLSFRGAVKAYRIPRFLCIFKAGIEVIDLGDYFDWAQCAAIGSKAVDIWESILPGFPASGWKLKIRGSEIDLSLKAKQQLQNEIEKLLFLKSIAKLHNTCGEKARIINCLKFDFLSRAAIGHELFHFPAAGALSGIFIFLDRLNLALENLLRSCACVCRFLRASFANERPKRAVRYLCAGLAVSEWLVDGSKICRDDIIFLKQGSDMLKFASRRKIISSFAAALCSLIKCVLVLRWDLQNLLLAGYEARIIPWAPVIETLRPRVYIDSISSAGFEDPAVVYLKQAKGIKTVMWSYGINSCPLSNDRKSGRLRLILLSHIISSDFVAWNQHYREFIEYHIQNGLRTHVLGPLMCGDEGIMHVDKKILFEKIQKPYNHLSRYIAVFDVPPLSSGGSRFSAVRCGVNSARYNYEFMRDMVRLLSDFEEVVLVYKPQRPLNSREFSYADELKNLLGQTAAGTRMIILRHDINPWFAIAASDICISIPFVSASVAAIHYEKIGIFHDPANIVLGHRYEGFDGIITHSYDELRSKVAECLHAKRRPGDMLDDAALRKIQGGFAGENSSNRFREYLASF